MFHYFQEHDLEVPVGTYTLLRRFYVLISKNMKLDTSTFKKHGIRHINFQKNPIWKWRYVLYTKSRPKLGIHPPWRSAALPPGGVTVLLHNPRA